MIDLVRTKAAMLVDIGATDNLDGCYDPEDAALHTLDQAWLKVEGRRPDDLLPSLTGLLYRRFPAVPRERLFDDLINPLKQGLGNAYKRGNQKNHDKSITVELVLTRTGALVAVSDQGNGFDVGDVVLKLRNGERYFLHGGSGLARFERSGSVIGYADGGRTLLIRFLCLRGPGRPMPAAERSALGVAGDEQFMKSVLEAELPHFQSQGASLESCRVFAPSDEEEEGTEIKYLLEYRRRGAKTTQSLALTGRLLPEPAARTDFAVARQLLDGPFRGTRRVRVPRPVAMLKEPSMVLFEFAPTKGFREFAKKVESFRKFAAALRAVATGLRLLHQSAVMVESAEAMGEMAERNRVDRRRVECALSRLSPARVERFRQVCDRLSERSTTLKPCEPVCIHGAFGWNNILYQDKQLHFYRFDQSRPSHPGFDVGGFLADMLRFYVIRDKGNPEFYVAGCDIFLESYAAGAAMPWREDLPYFVASALLLHLDRLVGRAEKKWEPKADALLEQCERVLSGARTDRD